MVDKQILFKKIPVGKTMIGSLAFFGIIGLILGLLIGFTTALKNPVAGIIAAIIFTATVVIAGPLATGLIAFGLNLGLKTTNGFPIDIETDEQKITIKKVDAIKSMLITSVVFLVTAIPIAIVVGAITMLGNAGLGLITIITVPILAAIGGAIIGLIYGTAINLGLTLARGLPIYTKNSSEKITLKGLELWNNAIVGGVESFVFGLIFALGMLIIYLTIPATLSFGTSAAAQTIGQLLLFMKNALLIAVVLLPIILAVIGFIGGALKAFGINTGIKAIGGSFEIDTEIKPNQLTVKKLDTVKTATLYAISSLIGGIISALIQSIFQISKSGVLSGLFEFVILLVMTTIIGGASGFAVSKAIEFVKGYEIDGENLDLLINTKPESAAKKKK